MSDFIMADRRMYIDDALAHVLTALRPQEISEVGREVYDYGGHQLASKISAFFELRNALRRGDLFARAETWGHPFKDEALFLGNKGIDLLPEIWQYAQLVGNNAISWPKVNPRAGDIVLPDSDEFAHGVHLSVKDIEAIWRVDVENTLLNKKISTEKMMKTKGRTRGTGYANADRRLFAEIDEMLEAAAVQSANGAALKLAHKIVGNGTAENRARRVANLYNAERKRPAS